MAKPFSLQPVLDLMQVRTDDATRQLARLIANERDARNKLTLLQQYREEYATRFRAAAQIGLSPREWHNYQEFLIRLDEAVDAQRRTVDAQVARTATGQAQWQQQKKKLKAFDTLADRHMAGQHALESRNEQKAQDEFAGRRTSDEE